MIELLDLQRLQLVATRYSDISIYLFGSSLIPGQNPRDTDVLVLYTSVEQLADCRSELQALDFENPLDLIAMTPAEEDHYDFIRIVKAEIVSL